MNQLLQKYQAVRLKTEQLCSPLRIEDYGAQPVAFVSPPKWHLAHSTWFFETFLLKTFQPTYEAFNEQFGFLFNSYYNGIGDRIARDQRGTITRPTVEEVYAYRKHVDEAMLKLLETASVSRASEISKLVELGLNHEQQHQELLLTDIKYILGNNPIFPVYDVAFDENPAMQNAAADVEIKAGIFSVGSNETGTFLFDNEMPAHEVALPNTKIQHKLVTNGEYLEFMNAGGYAAYDHWLDEGWWWLKNHKISAPLYWHKVVDEWFSYQLSGLKKIDLNAPVTHISFYEAAAYADWKGMRLPTEFEWEAAADQFSWGQRWEWTHSAYLPYPGFKRAKGAIGEYNGKFMINQMVLRGSSVATPEGHSRKTYRNFFHASERWQFNGIRLAK